MTRRHLHSETPVRWIRRSLVALVVVAAGVGTGSSFTAALETDATRAEQIARGRRVSFTSGCQDCHTPGTFYGSPDTTRTMSGSELGWEGPWGVSYPRNLTPDLETGIGKWTEEDIVTAVRTGHRPDQTMLLPPMPWPMYAHLTDEDAYALAAYLKSLPPIRHKVPDAIPPDQGTSGPRLTFPAPPEWDGRNLPKAPDLGEVAANGKKH